MLEEEILKVYVDASVSANNHGGIGAVVISIDHNGDEITNEIQLAGYSHVNSGQMEIIACTDVLDEISYRQLDYEKKQIQIYTDSKYVCDNYRPAMFHWVGKNWLENSRPISDANEWSQLVKRLRKFKKVGVYVDVHWVKGHGKNLYNDLAHALAKRAAHLPASVYSKNSVLSAFRPRQIKAPRKLEIGSVKMKGQKVSIGILGIEYFSLHQLWSCKYTVTSKKSLYRGYVDKAFSATSLDIGKKYFVKFNNDQRIPMIEKVYKEIGTKQTAAKTVIA
jgi:ribonuclease HI